MHGFPIIATLCMDGDILVLIVSVSFENFSHVTRNTTNFCQLLSIFSSGATIYL